MNNKLQFTPRRASQRSKQEQADGILQAIVLVFALIFFMSAGLLIYAVGKGL